MTTALREATASYERVGCRRRMAGRAAPEAPQAEHLQQSFCDEPVAPPQPPTIPTTQEDPLTMAIAPQRSEIGIRRHFTTPGVHPYDEVRWERRDARITNYRDGSVAFEQLGVEVPESWSLNATNILAQKYFRGTLNTSEREGALHKVA